MTRSELSEKNIYYLPKYRRYELKYYCLQFPIWKKAYDSLSTLDYRKKDLNDFNNYIKSNNYGDPTAKRALALEHFSKKMDLIKKTAIEADEELCDYILIGVTQGKSYDWLYANKNIPCSKGTYYDRYHRFFWLLSKYRD